MTAPIKKKIFKQQLINLLEQGVEKTEYVGVIFRLRRLFSYYKISSRKKKIVPLKVPLLCYNRNNMMLRWIRLEDNHVETKL